MCSSNNSWPSKVTPMSFSVAASARRCFSLFGDNEKSSGSSIFLFTHKTLHLSGGKFNNHVSLHVCRRSRSLCSFFLSASFFILLYTCRLQIEKSLTPFLLGDRLYIAQPGSGPIHCLRGFHWLRYSIPTEPRLLSLFVIYYFIQFTVCLSIPYDLFLWISLLCGTWSNAFIKSRYTAFISYPCSTAKVQSSIIFRSCNVVDLLSMKPYCCLLNNLFFLICLIISLLISFSIILHIILVRLTGL